MHTVEIKLPTLDWFSAGNLFTGSYRFDASKSCINQTTFHYRVGLIHTNDQTCLLAVCRFILPWNQCANMDETFVGRFEADSFGIQVAESWILGKILISAPQYTEKISPPMLSTNALDSV